MPKITLGILYLFFYILKHSMYSRHNMKKVILILMVHLYTLNMQSRGKAPWLLGDC